MSLSIITRAKNVREGKPRNVARGQRNGSPKATEAPKVAEPVIRSIKPNRHAAKADDLALEIAAAIAPIIKKHMQ